MRKLLLVLGLTLAPAYLMAEWFGGWTNIGDVSISSSTALVQTTTPTISWIQFNVPDKGVRNCLTKVDFSLTTTGSNLPGTFSVLDGLGGTTSYSLIYGSTTPNYLYWDYQNALCLSPGVTTYLQVNISSGSFKLNAVGYQRK